MVLRAMAVGFLAELVGVGVEGTVDALQFALAHADGGKLATQGRRIRRFHRTEAAIAAAIVARAERAAAGVGDRAKTRRAVGDHDADVALQFALNADAVGWRHRLA